jgi:hypothetical protein
MKNSSRTVRVFLSSTFRDFSEERDLLVRKVFPELRRKCRERQVELVDVDLRWGITEKEAQQGKVLPICLAEIDRARPYFIGFIGERYGWIPASDQYDPSVVLEQPWLVKHRGGKSVTELEILHGVFNNRKMKNRAFFYFRDSEWSLRKGGAYLSEGTQEKARLDLLKQRIRKRGFHVVENYPSPENLAERIKEDLWKLIDDTYPESEVPSVLAQERKRHEAYGATRQRLYLGGERYFDALNEAMKVKNFRPVLITGLSGGGKSALVANWVAEWSQRHKKSEVIVHHLGCGADASDPVRMATRIMQEIALLTGDEFKPEINTVRQLEQLPKWIALAGSWAQRTRQQLLIVLDGLDKLSDQTHLRWFPSLFPPRIKLVVSCLSGEVFDAAKGLVKWQELKVKPFTKTEQKRFIVEYLGRYRKTLTRSQTLVLQAHPLCGNPLFLLTVLEELRVFGVHEKLEDRLHTLLSRPPSKADGEPPTVDDVFEHVLARIEADIGQRGVRYAMEAIWASRVGLYQDELLAIAKLTPVRWAAIQSALDESLYESSGKISFGHDYLRKAVEDRYLSQRGRIMTVHQKLGDFFTSICREQEGGWKKCEPRAYAENVHHYIKARRLDKVSECLCDFSYLFGKLRSDYISQKRLGTTGLVSLLEDCRLLVRGTEKIEESLRYWVGFINDKSHFLIRGDLPWPTYKILIQLACEDADTSPATIAAESWLEQGHCDWLWMRRMDRPKSASTEVRPKVLETEVFGVAQPSPLGLFSWDHRSLKLWELESGEHAIVARAPKMAFMSLDGSELVAVFEDGVAWIDPTSGKERRKLPYRGHKLDGGILLMSGDVLTWSDQDKKSQIWNRSGLIGSWKKLWMPETCRDFDLIFFRGYLSLDENRLLFWGDDSGLLRVWDVPSGKVTIDWCPHSGKCEKNDPTFSLHLMESGNLITHEEEEFGSVVRLWSGDDYTLMSEHRIDMKYAVVLPINSNRICVLHHHLTEETKNLRSYLYDFDHPGGRINIEVTNVLGGHFLNSRVIVVWTLDGKADMGPSDLLFYDIEGRIIGTIRRAHDPVSYVNFDHGLIVSDGVPGTPGGFISQSSVDCTIKIWPRFNIKNLDNPSSLFLNLNKLDPLIFEEKESYLSFYGGRGAKSMICQFKDGFQLQWTASPHTAKPFEISGPVTGAACVKAPVGHSFDQEEIEYLDFFEVSSLQLLWNGIQLSCFCEFTDGGNRFDGSGRFREIMCRIIEAPPGLQADRPPADGDEVCGTRLESGAKSVDFYADWDDADKNAQALKLPYPLPSARWEADVPYRLRWIDANGCIVLESFSGQWIRLRAYDGAKPLNAADVVKVKSAKTKLRDALATLTEHEREILEQRFGFKDGYARTLEEVARQFKVTRERIGQIEAKALRKMRHPTRIRKLEGFINLSEAGEVDCADNKISRSFNGDKVDGIYSCLESLIAENIGEL